MPLYENSHEFSRDYLKFDANIVSDVFCRNRETNALKNVSVSGLENPLQFCKGNHVFVSGNISGRELGGRGSQEEVVLLNIYDRGVPKNVGVSQKTLSIGGRVLYCMWHIGRCDRACFSHMRFLTLLPTFSDIRQMFFTVPIFYVV